MTEQTKDTKAENKIALPYAKDWLLVNLIKIANDTDLEMGITLTVGGSAIAGTLISGKTYFKEMAAAFRSAAGNAETTASIADYYESFTQIYQKPEGAEGEEVPSPEPGYVHLRKARYVSSGESFPTEGSMWRGRLEAVDGFSIGELQVSRR